MALLLFLVLSAAAAEVFFEEAFDDESWQSRWVQSQWHGSNGPAASFEWSAGDWSAEEKLQRGIRTPQDMSYHSISSKFEKPFSNRGKDLVVQFSVKHESKEFTLCGGGYIKLLGSSFVQETFGGPTEYKLMFGPDICGYDVARIHVIFSWRGNNLLRKPELELSYEDKNDFSHLYTLVLKPDNSYKVYMDLKERASGNLHDHWEFPKRTLDDPSDRKPEDWVDVKKIENPAQIKPADWVDAQRIRDPAATPPAEWDEEEDGTWEAPMIDNPKYKGEWFRGIIDNPKYKGEWKPKQLENPDFVEDVHAYDDIGGVGFELWTVNKGSIFDNILICDSFEHAKSVGEPLLKIFAKEKEAKKAWEKANGIESTPDSSEDDDEEESPGHREEL